LLHAIKTKLHSHEKLLTIAVGATAIRGRESYNIPKIAAKVDFINLMTYDLHGAWDRKTGINAPLYSSDELSVDSCVKFWLAQGCPKEKLVVGIPLYGRSFTILDTISYDIGQPASAGKPGKFIRSADTAGFLPYNEICSNLKNKGWTRMFATNEKAPFAYRDDQWVGYDDLQSVNLKIDYILSNQLGGAMFWSIESDDFGRKLFI
jgi:chitinase